MRTDEHIAAVFEDGADLRALLLGARDGELAPLREAAGVEAQADPDRLALAIDAVIADGLDGDEGAPALRLALWAARRLHAPAPLRTIDDADREIVRLSPMAADGLAGTSATNESPGAGEAKLLRIATSLAHLRRCKAGRLRRWRPWLDWLVGHRQADDAGAARLARPAMRVQAEHDEPAPEHDALWDLIRSAGGHLPLSVWEERLTEVRKTLGRFNIIVAGRTGVGKTTLIGAIFGEEVGNTLMGRPRTRGRIWYPLDAGEADVLRLCDTEGLEMERYEETLDGLKREIEARNASSDPFDHIHVAWLCIDEPSLTVQPGEEALVKLLTREGIPVIVVLTKAGMAPAFAETVKALLPGAGAVIRVRAAPIDIEGQSFAQMGLDELMRATEDAIPNAVEAAWHVASRNLEANIKRSEIFVRRAAVAAGAAGAAPIPLADAAGVFGVQVGMIIAVSLNMGVKLKRSDLRAMAVTLLGALGLTAGGRFIAGQFAKLIPGLGTIAGSAVTGSTAAALTYGLGRAYLEYLRSFFEKNRRMPNSNELVSGFRRYWSQWKNKYEPPPMDAKS
jgi:uncharacterized protein (DUF697 family)